MTLISNFELLVKRIAPTSGNPNIDAPFRRVVQGYFLHISNPNDRTVSFRIRAYFPRWTNLSSDSLVDRELVGGNSTNRNHIYTYDVTGGPNNGQDVYEPMRCRSSRGGVRTMITRNLSLGPLQTAAFKLLPDVTSPAISLGDPRMEVRGYLEIAQVSNFFGSLGNPGAIELMFTPETRGTFLDNSYPDFNGSDLDFDQIAYSMPTSTGGALMEVSKVELPLVLCFPFPPELKLEVPDLVIEKPLAFVEDFQGHRYLSNEGNDQLQEIIKKFMNDHEGVRIDMISARRQVEAVLNDDHVSPRD